VETEKEKAFSWPKEYPLPWFLVGVVIGVCLWILVWYLYPLFIKNIWTKLTSFFWF